MQAARPPPGTYGAPPPAAATGPLRRWLAALAGVYALFVVYGSLVPLQPVAMPLAESWARFLNTPWPALAGLSRTDLAVNVGLTVPLAFLLRAALAGPGASGPVALVAGLVTWLLCALLSVGVEWAQVYFPDRSHSWSDVLAQWLGAAIGLALHRWRGPAFHAWALGWWQAQSGAPAAVWLLRAWLPALALASLVPLDLSISPVELYRKWRDGRVNWVPLSDLPPGLMAALWELASDMLLWAPVGAVWRLQGRGLGWVLRSGLLAATLIEAAQLLVLSRFTSSTDLLSACAGCLLGALVAARLAPAPGVSSPGLDRPTLTPTPTRAGPLGGGPWLWAWWGWALLLLLVFWAPYDANLSPEYLRGRLREALTRLPFEALYWSSEERAVSALLRKVLMCVPLGIFWTVWRARARPEAGLAPAAGLLGVALLVLVVEAGQLAVPIKVADATDVALGVLGAWLGQQAAARLLGRRGAPAAQQRTGAAPARAAGAGVGVGAATATATATAAAAVGLRPVDWTARLPALDGLRALACLMVFAVHFGQISQVQGQWGPFDLGRLLDNGNTGVALFFTLSAFLLSTPFWLAMRHQRAWPGLGAYWAMRLARVLPAYYLCLLALVLANRLWRQDDAAINLLLHLGFVFNLSEAHAMRINPPFWTLAVELQFYLLLPGLMWLLKGSDPRRAAVVLVLLAALAYGLHATVVGLALLPPLVSTYSLLAHLPHFLLGVATAAWCCSAPAPQAGTQGRRRLLMGLLGLALLLVLATPLDEWLRLPQGRYNLPWVPAGLCLLVALASRAGTAGGGVLASGPLRALGGVSYAVYLFHLPVMHLTERLMPRLGLSAQADWALFGGVALAATLLLAALSWVCLERPVLRAVRRRVTPDLPR